MPPHSKSIFEEGAVFKSFFLVKKGEFQVHIIELDLFTYWLNMKVDGSSSFFQEMLKDDL